MLLKNLLMSSGEAEPSVTIKKSSCHEVFILNSYRVEVMVKNADHVLTAELAEFHLVPFVPGQGPSTPVKSGTDAGAMGPCPGTNGTR